MIMALTRPNTATLPEAGEIPEVPDGLPRHRGDGRPWIRHADDTGPPPPVEWHARKGYHALAAPAPGRGDYYSRASSFGKPIEDQYRLNLWKLRRTVEGMSRDEGLLMRAQALASEATLPEGDPDRRALRERWDALADEAIDAGKGTAEAEKGTAFHLLSERRDRGDDLSYLPAHLRSALDEWDRMMSRFEVVGTEQFVVDDELEVAGTYDRLLRPRTVMEIRRAGTVIGRVTPGDLIIADLKSGKRDPRKVAYATQQIPYAAGRPYSHDGGRTDWPDGVRPSQTWAIIPHVSHADGGASAQLYWVHLPAARARIDLLRAIKQGRRVDDLFVADECTPAAAEQRVPAQVVKVELMAALRVAEDRAALDALYDLSVEAWDEDCTRMAKARLSELGEAAT
jgi:hypothetical protein